MIDDYSAALERGQELVRLGRDAQAMEVLLPLLGQYPEHAGSTHAALAFAHLALKRYDEGLEHARATVQALPDHARGHLLVGLGLASMRRDAEALAPLHEAGRLDVTDPVAMYTLAKVLSRLGDSRQAYDAADEALRRDPQDPDAHFAMGFVLHDDFPDRAASAYRQALALDPHHAAAQHNLANMDIVRGDTTEGTRRLVSVLAQNPNAQYPTFVIDQTLVDVIRNLHWVVLGLTIAYKTISASLPWVAAAVLVVAATGLGAWVLRIGLRPLRTSLPLGAARHLRAFPGREPVGAAWLGLLVVAWAYLVVLTVVRLRVPDAWVVGSAAQVPLLVAWVLSWVRIPLARRRMRRAGMGR